MTPGQPAYNKEEHERETAELQQQQQQQGEENAEGTVKEEAPMETS